MSEPVITVEGLGKRYVLAHEIRHDTVRDSLAQGARKLLRGWNRGGDPTSEEFWAIRDVSFTLNRGEVMGIIGRNGAGKSTLLKILSRITEPTVGRVHLRGRVASLLEVGTGFHPELTGRENVFLNGAILGMSRQEIRSKFDEIVEFAEVERFLDTPVKHYSSGMYVRLAFAVAAHLEPEILIVDEVLSVGDHAFQKKCIGKMESVSRTNGRTVLFVSHNLSAIRELCQTGVLLSGGTVVCQGPIGDVVSHYTGQMGRRSHYRCPPSFKGELERAAWFESVSLTDSAGASVESYPAGSAAWLEAGLFLRRDLVNAQIAARISTQDGVAVMTTANTDVTRRTSPILQGRHRMRALLPAWLAPGFYSVTIAIHEPRRHDHCTVNDAIQFEITPGQSPATALHDDRRGFVEPIIAWEPLPPN